MRLLKLLFILFIAVLPLSYGQVGKFTLIIDAGHGGHDPGAGGKISQEKDLNLSVALKLGELIEKNFTDVRIIYTRKTDVFVTLQRRADIANENHADLFLSIHTNAAVNTTAYGTETYTLGLHKSEANLQVAMRENSVILLEDDYKTKYKGFDPNSVDSYIMFQFLQDKYIDRSVNFASGIQSEFRQYANRSDRGVRQAGLWVLHRSACPSVLTEIGFISNSTEEKYMASSEGQKAIATSIYNAFVRFKREHDKKSGNRISDAQTVGKTGDTNIQETKENSQNTEAKNTEAKNTATKDTVAKDTVTKTEVKTQQTQEAAETPEAPVFKIQILAASKKLPDNSSELKGLKNVDFYFENKWYKYTVGAEKDYTEIKKLQEQIKKKFPDAFVIAFTGAKKITESEAVKLLKKN
jgi:N-acetylmuramoyl-L-alanine amidase